MGSRVTGDQTSSEGHEAAVASDTATHETGHPQTAEELMSSGAFPLAPEWDVLEPVAAVLPAGGKRRRGRLRGRFWRDLGIGGLLVVLTHIFLVQVSVVRGLSMSPSLHDGDRLMVDRISYSLTDVARFDVVVLRYPRNPKVDFVKRIIGLPGDHVELRAGMLYVNGETIPEEFGHVVDAHERGSWTVPADAFFVLGDNRPISCDSREFGTVNRDLLKGKVRVVFWPPSRFAVF
jgi:signal peptidase I